MNEHVKRKKNIKITIIILFVLILTIIIIMAVKNQYEKNKIKEKLTNNKYNETSSDIYKKKNNNIIYTFDLNKKEYSKTITNQDTSYQENIILNIKNNMTTAYYNYKNNDGCRIEQNGTYIDSNFKCNIEYNTTNCKSRCDKMLKEIKDFNKEYEKLLK